MVQAGLKDSLGSGTIAIGIGELVFHGASQHPCRFLIDSFLSGSHERGDTGVNALLPFGYIAGHENWYAQCRGFFLNTTGIRENHSRFRHCPNEVGIVQRIRERKVRNLFQVGKDWFTDIRIGVDGESKGHRGMIQGEPLDRVENAQKR